MATKITVNGKEIEQFEVIMITDAVRMLRNSYHRQLQKANADVKEVWQRAISNCDNLTRKIGY